VPKPGKIVALKSLLLRLLERLTRGGPAAPPESAGNGERDSAVGAARKRAGNW